MRLLWLPDVLADAGFKLHVEPGWEYRGFEFQYPVRGVVAHHTATPAHAQGDYPSLRIVRDGRLPPDPSPVPGPLSQLGLGRSGKVYVIASGRANHAGTGGWLDWLGNRDTVGIEAEHPGGSAPWDEGMYDVYVRLCRLLVDELGLSEHQVIGHKEWAPTRKSDPTFPMSKFRSDIGAVEMVSRSDKVEPHPDLVGEYEKLRESAVYTEYTEPGGLVFNDNLAAFLNRHFDKVVKPAIAEANASQWNKILDWVRDHVKTSIAAAFAAGAGSAQVDYGELAREIGRILSGG